MLKKLICNVKETSPLIHNITNYVTVNDCANILLACGASPIMADDEGEVEEITSICDGLVINLGTLNSRTITAMGLALEKAFSQGKPTVLDPVGAGASSLRTQTAVILAKSGKFSVIRGNLSEIKSIFYGKGSTQGVDASVEDEITEQNIDSIARFAMRVSEEFQSIIAISGKIDIITDGQKTYVIRNGSTMMSKITGCGCMLSALTGAYIAANQEYKLEACAAAFIHMSIGGEKAYQKVCAKKEGTGSFRTYLLDYINTLTLEEIEENTNYEIYYPKQTCFHDKFNIKEAMKLYLVTDRTWLGSKTLAEAVEESVGAGATFVQLREKNIPFDRFVKEAIKVKEVTDRYGVPFVINDNIDVAILVDADGVHIGQSDEDISSVRKRLGQDKIIGLSAHTVEEAVEAQNAGADYIGVGAIFGTTSKADAQGVSLEELKQITGAVTIPVVAIGGINEQNVLELKNTNVDGIAVISAILEKNNIKEASEHLLELVNLL